MNDKLILLIPTLIFLVTYYRQIQIMKIRVNPNPEVFLFFIYNVFIMIAMWIDNPFLRAGFMTVVALISVWAYRKR